MLGFVSRLGQRLGEQSSERACRCCGMRFDRDPPNCPACGGVVERLN